MLDPGAEYDEQGLPVKTHPHRPTTPTLALPIPDDPGTHTTYIGVTKMFGARAKYDTAKHHRLNHIVTNNSAQNTETLASPPTNDKTIVASSVENTHK